MTVEVEIEHRYYQFLLDIKQGSSGEILLKPIDEKQKHAVIRYYAGNGKEHLPIKEYTLNLTGYGPGKTRIKVEAHIDKGKLLLKHSIYGKTVLEDSINVKKYLKKKYSRLAVITAAAVLLAGLLFFSFSAILRSTPVSSSGEKNYSRTASEETAPDKKTPAETAETAEKTEAGYSRQIPAALRDKTIIYFYPNSAVMKESEYRKLEDLLEALKDYPDIKLEIDGHCAFFGTKEGRIKISRERAEKIADYLTSRGWNPGEEPVVKWYGAMKPVSDEPEKSDRNRRVEIIPIGTD